MKLVILVILAAALIILLSQLYFILKERNQMRVDIGLLGDKLDSLAKENSKLHSEIEYYSHPENLVKELKTRFNYKQAGEKMLIILP